MTSLSEQLSAVRQSQWETQLDMLHSLSSRAIDSAEQLIALNMKTSRASVEQATGTLKQLLEVTNPRDLAALGSAAQGQWQHVLDYSRALFGIAAGGRPAPGLFGMPSMPTMPTVTLPASVPQAFEQLSIATAAATSRTTEIASAAADTGAALAEATLHAGAQEVSKAKEAFTAATPAPEPETVEVTELDAETAGAGPDEAPAAAPASPAEPAAAAPAEPEAAAPAEPATVAAAATPATAHAASTTPLGAVFENAAESASTDAIPLAKTTQVADAVQQLATHALGAEHPSAAIVPLDTGAPVETPHMTPVDSTPPVVAAAPQAKPPRASRKK